ncbi:MAG: zf-TFIIB domain-containing protein [Kiritimatiellae bacterium]|nr:zf-TFIIB domain-containing protein [Kiritimatiellia bacterium]
MSARIRLSLTNLRNRMCPRCRVRLKPVDLRGIEVDTCPQCEGVWFDHAEIEAFLGAKRRLPDYVSHVYRVWTDSDLRCPSCGQAMSRLRANDAFPFDIDMCPLDEGYWFDRGELDGVAATAAKKALSLRPPAPYVRQKAQATQERELTLIGDRAARVHAADEPSAAPLVERGSFWELTGPQKLVALMGLPVESGEFYAWRSGSGFKCSASSTGTPASTTGRTWAGSYSASRAAGLSVRRSSSMAIRGSGNGREGASKFPRRLRPTTCPP